MIFTSSVCQSLIALHALNNEEPQRQYSTKSTGTKYETLQNKHFPGHSNKGSIQTGVS